VALLCLAGAMASAQQTTVELKSGEVVAVDGNRLVVRGPEGVKEYNVPEGFRFDMDGKSLSVNDLKPGMKLSAIITVTEKPIQMTTTEVREAEVLHKVGSTIVVRTTDGEIKRFSPKDVKEKDIIMHDRQGNPIEIGNLDKGDTVTATIVTKQPPTTLTERDFQVFVENPPPARPVARAQPAPPPPPAPPARKPVELPKTGSGLPLLGLTGALMLAVGLGLTLFRRFRTTA
jgi:LPXTG-motif cell wall-anchored protein